MTEEQKLRAQAMKRMGNSIRYIAESLGVSYGLVHKHVAGFKVVLNIKCLWCPRTFEYEVRRGKPPGFCSEACRRYDEADRRRKARMVV